MLAPGVRRLVQSLRSPAAAPLRSGVAAISRSALIPRVGLLGVVLVLLGSLPNLLPDYEVTIMSAVGLAVIGSVATNMLIGVAGQAAIGNAAFMAIGGFVASSLSLDLGLPCAGAVVGAGAAAGIVGAVVGIPAARLRGLYLVVATLALHFVVLYVATEYQIARTGQAGFLMPQIRLASLSSSTSTYYVITACAVGSAVIMRNIIGSRFGRAWSMIARDENAAEVLGVDVRFNKQLVFALTSAMMGAEGALFGYYLGVVTIESFSFDLAVQYLAMIVIGGLGSVGGSILGAAFVVALPYWLARAAELLPTDLSLRLASRLFDVEVLLYGLAIIFFLIVEPAGLWALLRRASHGLTRSLIKRGQLSQI